MLKEEEEAAAKAITGHLPVAVHAGIVTATVLWSRRRHQACSFVRRPVRLAYQPPASSTFLLEQTSYRQPANSTFLSEQISTSHQQPAKRTG
jgi:hypothetical protein